MCTPLCWLQHDEGPDCGSLGSEGGKGRYLMFPHASNNVQENNDKFSPCSLKHISQMLKTKKDDCFVGESQETSPLGSRLAVLFHSLSV